MKRTVVIISFITIIHVVTAPPPNAKSNYPLQAPSIPRRYDFTSKINDFKKPSRESDLVNLIKGNAFTRRNDINTDVKQEHNMTKELTDTNVNKILYADEISVIEEEIEKTDEDSPKKVPEAERKEESKRNNTDFPKKFLRNEEKNKIGPMMKSKINDGAHLKPLELPPSMIPIFKPNPYLVRSAVKNENMEPVLRSNIPIQETLTNTSRNNFPNQIIPNIAQSTVPLQESISDTARPFPPNQQSPAPGHKHIAENIYGELNPIPNGLKFNIPCQKASDVLEEIPVKSELHMKPNLEPKVREQNGGLYEQGKVEETGKVKTDDSVAIIFKPKNISLFNVYGDLLKKVTLTVLVPYHISKLNT